MQKKKIKIILAGFLLVIFALSITPKQFLHKVFANHTDNSSLLSHGILPQLHKAGIHCQCDDLVVENPFVGCNEQLQFQTLHFIVFVNCPLKQTILTATVSNNCLRGPPAFFS